MLEYQNWENAMDFQYYINILLRRKWLILAVLLATSSVTFYFVNRLPNTYKTSATLTTSIVPETGLEMRGGIGYIPEALIKMGFSTLLELVNSQRSLIYLSYRLLIHDLDRDGINDSPPFRSLANKEDINFNYSQPEVDQFVDLLKGKLDSLDDSFDNIDNQVMFEQLSVAYGYDYENLLKNHFEAKRKGDSDLLEISFQSEDPELSFFAVNSFVKDFIRIDRNIRVGKESTEVTFYTEATEEVKKRLDEKKDELNIYKGNRSLIDVGAQSTTLVDQIRNIEGMRELEAAKIPALKQKIETINSYMSDTQRNDASSTIKELNDNKKLTVLDDQIDKLIILSTEANGKDQKIERRLKATQKQRDDYVKKLTGSEKNRKRSKEDKEDDLLDQRIEQELALIDAEQSLQNFDEELIKLRNRLDNLVSDEAFLDNLEQEIDELQDEYNPLVQQLNKAQLELENTYQPIRTFQMAKLPERPEPKHTIIIAAFAGLVAAAFTMMVILLLTLLDYTLQSPHQFKKFVKLPLLGTVNKVKTKNLDLQYLFNSNGHDLKLESFRESLRNLRYSIENSGGTRFLFTSPKNSEGKTFMIITLAHALTIKGKKVLIVDTNFKNNTLSRMSKKGMEADHLTTKLIGDSDLEDEFVSKNIHTNFNMKNVDIIGNKGTYQSPSEVFAGKGFTGFIDRLSSNYDYIFFESAALNRYSDTKELIEYVDGVIAVFSAESEFKSADKNSISYFKSLGPKYLGSILNKVDLKHMA